MITDFHTHAFNDKIARSALERLIETGGALKPTTDGTLGGLRAKMSAREDMRAVVLPIATKPSQMRLINEWAASETNERTVIFGSIHPDAPDALSELDYIGDAGLKGIKFHPEYQDFKVDDARMFPIYKKAAALGLITVFHSGYDIGFEPPPKCSPAALARALPHFDGAPVVAAHFGGYMMWNEVIEHLCGLPIYLDTSYSHTRIIRSLAIKIIEAHGAEKMLFGSDLPWSEPEYELEFIETLGLGDSELNLILRGNAERLLRIGQ